MGIWQNTITVGKHSYTCGHCDKEVGPSEGYYSQPQGQYIYICPHCEKPTYVDRSGGQTPRPLIGRKVSGITDDDVAGLYLEVRKSAGAGAHTSAVMACRKILMHVAVQKGADVNQSFASYVDYLVNAGWVPPGSKPWVDSIREKGNEANHEILLMDQKVATQTIHFTEMLLRFVYELPSMVQDDSKSP